MLRRPAFSAWFVSSYLLIYIIFLASGNSLLLGIAEIMLFFSPLLIIAMVYSIIRYGTSSAAELKEGEEYGYSDRSTDKLGTL
ncbi:MAG TPA: hypothetical protein VK518_25845 [Puia sp.]|nr:hypothetical protein [Puia sp.]